MPGARTMAEVPASLRQKLEAGERETRTLVEGLVIDYRKLLGTIVDDLTPEESAGLAPDEPVTKRGWRAAAVLLDRLGPGVDKRLAKHPSDVVRGWASHTIGLESKLSLRQRLIRSKPFADDRHSGVREWAWLSVREHIAGDLHRAIQLLEPWARSRSANVRRFATESTRPRGVWCKHIRELRDNPCLAMPLLEPLRSDGSKYVQDSVANWLNDASKDQPGFVEDLCNRWGQESPTSATERICRRATRSIRKAEAKG